LAIKENKKANLD